MRFDQVDQRFQRVDQRFDDKLESVGRLILQVGGGVFGTLVVGIFTVLGSHL